MSCEEARQNAAAYALGALTDAEAEEFERHIAGCDADHGLASFTQAADRLAEAAPEMTPPGGLRSRIIAAAEAHLATESAMAGAAATATAPYAPPAAVYGMAGAGSGVAAARSPRRRLPVFALAACVIAALTALIAWNVTLQLRDDPPVQLRHFYSEDDGDWLRVEAGLGKPGMTLAVGGLDHLDDAAIYEFWAIRNGDWFLIGDFNTNPEGRWAGDFDFVLEAGDAVAITVGPAPEGEWPTGEPEIRTRI